MSRWRYFVGSIAALTAIAAFTLFTGTAFTQGEGDQPGATQTTFERDGEFSCRASVLRIQDDGGAAALEPLTAGAGEAEGEPPQPSSPCKPEEAGLSQYDGPIGCEVPPDNFPGNRCIGTPPNNLNPNEFLPDVSTVGLLYARTDQTPEDLDASEPKADPDPAADSDGCTSEGTPEEEGDHAESCAGVANIYLTADGDDDPTTPEPNSLHISAANSFASVTCVTDTDGNLVPRLASRSQVVFARLGTAAALDVIPGILPPGRTGPFDPEQEPGTPPPDGTNIHDHLDLGDARVHFNHVHRDTFVDAEGETHERITQQAVVLQRDHTADPNDEDFDPNADQSAIVVGEAVADFEGNPCEEVVVEEEGRITIVKDTEPEDNQDFRFTGNVEDGDMVFELDDDPNGTEPPLPQETAGDDDLPSRASFDRPPGDDFVVTEEEVEGFELEDIECQDPSGGTEEDEANRTARIDLAAGEEVICTFKNVKEAQVTVVKETDPEQEQDFEFRLQCEEQDENDDTDEEDEEEELCDEEFQLDDDGNDQGAGPETDGDDDLPNSRTFTVPAPSEIEIREEEVAGFTTTVVCKNEAGEEVETEVEDEGRRVEFDIEPGDHVTCTFRNVQDRQAQVTVVKETDPEQEQDFEFRLQCEEQDENDDTDEEDEEEELCDEEFQLDDDGNDQGAGPETDGDDDLPNSRTFTVPAPSEIEIREEEQEGFSTTVVCRNEAGQEVDTEVTDEGRRVEFDIEPDDHVTCTFKNVQDVQQGRIVIVKDTEPEDEQDFTFNGNVDDDGTFQLDDDGNDAGAGPETAGDDDLPNSAAFDRAPGQFNLTEEEVEGFELEDIDCDDENSVENEETRSVVINLEDDETVTCTFLNEAVEEEPEDGTVTVVKDTDPSDPQDFNFEIDRTQGQGSFQEEFVLDDDNDPAHPNQMTFTPGTGRVRIEEEGEDDDGFDLVSIVCQPPQGEEVDIDEDGDRGEVEFDLAAGEDVTCTFRNVPADEEEPEPEPEPEPQPGQGTIEIRKDVVDADKDESPVFHFTGDLGSFDLSENDESGVPDRREFTVNAGTIRVTEVEDPNDGFELFRIRCQGDEDGGTPEQQGPIFGTGNTATIHLDPGDDVRCRFINTTDNNDPGNEGPGNADPEDDDNSGSGSGGGGGNSGPGRLAARAFR